MEEMSSIQGSMKIPHPCNFSSCWSSITQVITYFHAMIIIIDYPRDQKQCLDARSLIQLYDFRSKCDCKTKFLSSQRTVLR